MEKLRAQERQGPAQGHRALSGTAGAGAQDACHQSPRIPISHAKHLSASARCLCGHVVLVFKEQTALRFQNIHALRIRRRNMC